MSALEELAQAVLDGRVALEPKGMYGYKIVVEPLPGPIEVPKDTEAKDEV